MESKSRRDRYKNVAGGQVLFVRSLVGTAEADNPHKPRNTWWLHRILLSIKVGSLFRIPSFIIRPF